MRNPLSKNAFEEFSDEHSLVYSSHFEEDAHTVVRGITLTTARRDEFLVQGNIEGQEVQLLQRQVSMHKPDSEMMVIKWAIMHLTLPKGTNLPHIFLDGNNRYHEDVYDAIFTKFHKLVLAPAPHETTFTAHYRIFTNPETIPQLPELLDEKMLNQLSSFGHHMDYELFENNAYVYLPGSATKNTQLNQMLSAARLLTSNFN